jgi:hypothetical protein
VPVPEWSPPPKITFINSDDGDALANSRLEVVGGQASESLTQPNSDNESAATHLSKCQALPDQRHLRSQTPLFRVPSANDLLP